MSETKRIWDAFLTERDKEVYKAAGYGKRGGLRQAAGAVHHRRAVQLLRRQARGHSRGLKQYRTHCGAEAWDAVKHFIVPLLELARENNLLVFDIRKAAARNDLLDSSVQVGKNHQAAARKPCSPTLTPPAPSRSWRRCCRTSASSAEAVILLRHDLHEPPRFFDVDTLILVGCTTSGFAQA